MQIQLNATELESAVTQYLVSEGMDLKNKTTDFEFEGTCAINIEVDENAVPEPKAKPKTRAKRKPKAAPKPVEEDKIAPTTEAKAEPVAEDTTPVEEVVEELQEQVSEEVKTEQPESVDDELFPVPETETKNEKSIFA